jgi:cell division protein FtsI (penicillin-binding protein 3)
MRQMMEGVVLQGTGRRARLEGYSSGGKTGSAQIFDFDAHRYTHTYNATYMGFAPVTNPAIVVVVTLNGTRGGSAGYGGAVAAPVFQTVATEALRVLDVPKDLPEEPPALVAQNQGEELADLAIADLAEPGEEEEEAAAEAPLPAASAAPADPKAPRAPNFEGMTMRAVLAEASARGLTVLLDGSGVARVQQPPPGSPLQQGERIRVQFAR